MRVNIKIFLWCFGAKHDRGSSTYFNAFLFYQNDYECPAFIKNCHEQAKIVIYYKFDITDFRGAFILTHLLYMGQKCCSEMPPVDYNNSKTIRNPKDKNTKYAQPTLLPAVLSVERRLGQFKQIRTYQRGIPGKIMSQENQGAFYNGELKDGKPHGKGKMYFPDGSIFVGYFYGGVPHGEGRMITNQGIYYEGQVFQGQADGKGKICNQIKGYIYQGKWKKDSPSGFGKQIWTGTSQYQGDFDNGFKSGTGIYKKLGDYQYRGGFFNDKFDGVGRVVYSNGQVYQGQWKNGQYEGTGKYEWPDSSTYSGGFLKGKKHGSGIYKISDGRIFQGQWKQGKRNGPGKLFKGSQFIEGKWVDDKFVGKQ